MNRFVQHLLICLLALSLPLSAWANLSLLAKPCPMQMTMAAGMDAETDCCADPADMGKIGSPCKTGQECKTGAQAQLFAAAALHPVQHHAPLVSALADPLRNADPGSVWRPPRV